MNEIKNTIDNIKNGIVSDDELKFTLCEDYPQDELFKAADAVRRQVYGDKVYIRGLIEFTNYCKNNCFYCGIRRGNGKINRFRLNKEQIIECCQRGYQAGFRTFVLQGGEDEYFSDDILTEIIRSIRERFNDCAITLSMGERGEDSYKKLYLAGANRYLLRHEAVNSALYSKLHPSQMSLENRINCIKALKRIGYQTGTGFMVGAPNQTIADIIQDIRFIEEISPQMIGIGPYIPHPDTPFNNYNSGSAAMTLRLIAIFRLMLPYALIPSTTALATIDPMGRILGLKAGANVVMPNLSPGFAKQNYTLYKDKAISGAESANSLDELKNAVSKAGYRIVTDRGDAVCKSV